MLEHTKASASWAACQTKRCIPLVDMASMGKAFEMYLSQVALCALTCTALHLPSKTARGGCRPIQVHLELQ